MLWALAIYEINGNIYVCISYTVYHKMVVTENFDKFDKRNIVIRQY